MAAVAPVSAVRRIDVVGCRCFFLRCDTHFRRAVATVDDFTCATVTASHDFGTGKAFAFLDDIAFYLGIIDDLE